jgi:hypothetical protein
MRKLLLTAVLLAAAFAACDTKDPSGPASVTITGPTPFTTTTTTSVPPTTTTTSTSTSTSTVPFALARTYISLGPVPPDVPNMLNLSLRQTAPAPAFAVLGFYTTPSGGGGAVQGDLMGTLDAGSFTGTLTAVTPECTAERRFTGSLNAQSLTLTGGQTLKDCKGSPLAFNNITMLATGAPPPVAPPPTVTTTVPIACGYAVSPGQISLDVNGGTLVIDIVTGPGCAWSSQRFVDWVTVQPPAGSGPSKVAITVAPNPGAPRSTTLVIAGQPFVINQSNVVAPPNTSSTTTTTTTTTTTIPF